MCLIYFVSNFVIQFLLLLILIWAAPLQNQQNDMRLAKTQISLGIRPVWSEFSLCAQ